MGRIALSLALCGWAGMSLACEPAVDPFPRDLRVEALPDCSFQNARETDDLSGNPVVDIGGGRVGQKLVENRICGTGEQLMFVDCARAEVIVLDGAYTDSTGGVSNSSIAPIQQPLGPIGLRPSTTVADLAAVAAAEDIGYTLNIFAELDREKPRNRFDPFCGCKLFYPDSAGAQN
jgi:hypothetical protein